MVPAPVAAAATAAGAMVLAPVAAAAMAAAATVAAATEGRQLAVEAGVASAADVRPPARPRFLPPSLSSLLLVSLVFVAVIVCYWDVTRVVSKDPDRIFAELRVAPGYEKRFV